MIVIDGCRYERQATDYFRVRAFEVDGHLEVTANRVFELVELDMGWDNPPVDPPELTEGQRQDREERAKKKAAQRAKKRVRHLCKSAGVDTLLTLTYRALQADLGLAKRHLKEFNRRVERVIPGFRFVATFELQKRGAWHMHLATHGIPTSFTVSGTTVKSYDLLRSIWRAITNGAEGTVNVKRRPRGVAWTSARISRYLSKYVVKDFETVERWVNRYAAYGDFDCPRAMELGLVSSLHEAIELAYGLLSQGHTVDTAGIIGFRDCFFLHAYRDSVNGGIPLSP